MSADVQSTGNHPSHTSVPHGLKTDLVDSKGSSCNCNTSLEIPKREVSSCPLNVTGLMVDIWDLVGRAVRIAVELGLHHDPHASARTTFNPLEVDLRRRLFWT